MNFKWKMLLVVLLALRATFAPWSYRPAGSSPNQRYRLACSVRRWPQQRLQRFSGTSKMLQLFRGKHKLVPDTELQLQHLVDRWALPHSGNGIGTTILCHWQAILSPSHSHSHSSVRLTTFLRC